MDSDESTQLDLKDEAYKQEPKDLRVVIPV